MNSVMGLFLSMFYQQNLLRVQKMNRRTFNLVAEAANFLYHEGSSRTVGKTLSIEELKTLEATLDLLIEVVQGPCPENQRQISGEV